ncbi:MAG: PIN domain-containing protein [Chloroflexota bacterium]
MGTGRGSRMNYLLDTTLLLDFVNGREGAVELVDRLFENGGAFYTCDVITCESLSGGGDTERRVIRGVLDALEYVALAPEGSRWAAESRRTGRSAPGARSLADALIAATARSLGAALVTRNPRDFERQGVRVLRYD